MGRKNRRWPASLTREWHDDCDFYTKGSLQAILQDNGYLTQLRTAIAGLIAAKYLANKTIHAIGVLGTGEQARMQVEILKEWTNCRTLYVWGRNRKKAQQYKDTMTQQGFDVILADTPTQLAQACNLIITTTAAKEPLLKVIGYSSRYSYHGHGR